MPDFTNRRNRFHYVMALNLLESMGVPPGSIYIRTAGTYENYRGEIRTQQPAAGTPITPETQISLGIGCMSAVDFMPYQFFYGLHGIRGGDHSWEEDARSLMAPFDAMTIRYEAAMRFHALRYEFGVIDAAHLKRFMELFEYEPGEDSFGIDEIMLLASSLPSLNEWGGNPAVVSMVFSRLFKCRIRVHENVKSSTPIPDQFQYKLGSKTARLGNETIIGRSFEERDSTYELVLSDVPAGEIRHLLPGGAKRRRIEKLLRYCMPGDLDYRISVKVDRSAARKETKRYLGYSSYI